MRYRARIIYDKTGLTEVLGCYKTINECEKAFLRFKLKLRELLKLQRLDYLPNYHCEIKWTR